MSPVAIGIGGAVLLALLYGTWRNPRLWSSLIWAFITSCVAVSAFIALAPMETVEKFLIGVLLLPLLCAGLQFWVYWNPHRWGIMLGMTAVTLVCGAILYITPSPI